MTKSSQRTRATTLITLFVGYAMLLASCAGRTPVRVPFVSESPLPPADVGTYLLREGDVISIKFWGNDELNDEIRIRPDGMISLPFIDEVKAAGRAPADLDRTLTDLYTGELTNPQITVILREAASERVYIGGEVRSQGVYELRGPVTLVQAIQGAGGFLDSARRKQVLLVRTTPEGRIARALNTLPILDGTDPDADVRLQASDIVFVPRARVENVDLFVEKYVTGLLPIQPVGTIDVFGTRRTDGLVDDTFDEESRVGAPPRRHTMTEERPLPWVEWIEMLFRRRRWILGGVAVGLAYALVSVALQPEMYRAKARILLTAQAVPNVRDAAMPLQQIRAEIALMKSPKLVRSVLEDRGLAPEDRTIESANPLPGLVQRLLPREKSIDAVAMALADRIDAQPVQGSNLVDIALIDEDPVWAAGFVNDLLTVHMKRIGDMGDQPQAQGFFAEQRDLLAERWREARSNLNEFRELQGSDLLSGDEEHFMGVVTGLESQLVAAQTQVLELEARGRYLAEEIQRHPKTVASESRVTQDDSVSMLEKRVLELEIEKSELLSRYTQESTLVRDLDRRLAEARKLLETKEGDTLSEELTAINPSYQALEVDLLETEASSTAARARVAALKAQISKYKTDLVAFDDVSAELERLQSEVDSAREAYRNYWRQQEAARFESAISESGIVNVNVVEAAEVPTDPEPSQAQTVLVFWTLLGLVVGLLLAVLRDLLDPTVQSARRIARTTDLPVVARVPSS